MTMQQSGSEDQLQNTRGSEEYLTLRRTMGELLTGHKREFWNSWTPPNMLYSILIDMGLTRTSDYEIDGSHVVFIMTDVILGDIKIKIAIEFGFRKGFMALGFPKLQLEKGLY